MNTISVGIYQFDIFWEDIEKNQKKIESFLQSLTQWPDILILPEMYTTGFITNPDKLLGESVDSQLNWQQEISDTKGISVLGSMVFPVEDKFYNRAVFTESHAKPSFYDKRHLFGIEKEGGVYRFGSKRVTFSFNGVGVMPQICYDLRFPVWARNTSGYHILIYMANWPSSRQLVWDTLLKARAIENQCYCIGVNRVGKDGNGIGYTGGSAVYDMKGQTILHMGEKEHYSAVQLSISGLTESRSRFGALNDADAFEIKNPELPPPGVIF